MSAAKHTAGPWTVHFEHVLTKPLAAIELSKLVEGTGEFSGVLPMVVGANGLCTAVTGCGPDGVNNARLIAAAPDLLERLRRLEVAANTVAYCYDKRPENFAAALQELDTEAESARAAIAKATGGES